MKGRGLPAPAAKGEEPRCGDPYGSLYRKPRREVLVLHGLDRFVPSPADTTWAPGSYGGYQKSVVVRSCGATLWVSGPASPGPLGIEWGRGSIWGSPNPRMCHTQIPYLETEEVAG